MKPLIDISIFNTLDRSVGKFIGSQSRDSSGYLELAAALTSYALRQGHVCLDLANLKNSEILENLDRDQLNDLWNCLKNHEWIGSDQTHARPLILSKTGKLYFHRYWHYEQRLIKSIKDRLSSEIQISNKPENLSDFLSIIPSVGEEQSQAIQVATHHHTTFISGGPGTGKTTTVLFILAFLTAHSKEHSLNIGLAAPTGKAAQRIRTALEEGLTNLPISNDLKEAIPSEAITLHRLLGYKRNSSQFRHSSKFPLPYDVVVVDEASMLDLLLFSKLFEALKKDTRLIMLGDRHQLASVEAGSIFGDLIEANQTNTQLAAHTVELKTNYRFGQASALHATCEAIKAGDSPQTLSVLSGNNPEVSLHPIPSPRILPECLARSLVPHYLQISKAKSPEEALTLLSELCLLTPHRKGGYGVEGLNAAMQVLHHDHLPYASSSNHFSGQPIIITENSYSLGLFNGDLGILYASDQEPEDLFAYFSDQGDSGLRKLPISSLPTHEPAYALTVHKSQGSEYRRVYFLIPPGDSPLITRELLYTAISRSRESVHIWGQAESIEQAIQRRTYRSSGILHAMR